MFNVQFDQWHTLYRVHTPSLRDTTGCNSSTFIVLGHAPSFQQCRYRAGMRHTAKNWQIHDTLLTALPTLCYTSDVHQACCQHKQMLHKHDLNCSQKQAPPPVLRCTVYSHQHTLWQLDHQHSQSAKNHTANC